MDDVGGELVFVDEVVLKCVSSVEVMGAEGAAVVAGSLTE